MDLHTGPSAFAVVVLFVLISAASTAPLNPYLGTHYTVEKGDAVLNTTASQPYLEVRNTSYHGAGPREEARAMCSVRTQDVNATANATITRRLHGVVTSRELHSSIHRLEVIIYGQMHLLWQSLDALRNQLSAPHVPSLPNMATSLFPDRNTVSFRYQGDAG